MFKLLNIEWAKFSKSNIIFLLGVFFLIFYPASMYFGKLVPDLPMFLPGRDVFYNFPTVWEYLGYAGSWMVFFFLGVMVIYTITHEVRFKTLRQTIINGMSRQSFFFSKYLVIVIISLFATVYFMLIGALIGGINGGFSFGGMFENEWAIPRFFLMSLSYLTFAFFLAFMIKKSGIAVFFYLTYILVIEFFLRILHGKYLGESLMNLYPMNVTEDLMPFPFLKYAKFLEESEMPVSLLAYGEASLITIGYILLFVGITYFSFMRRDI